MARARASIYRPPPGPHQYFQLESALGPRCDAQMTPHGRRNDLRVDVLDDRLTNESPQEILVTRYGPNRDGRNVFL